MKRFSIPFFILFGALFLGACIPKQRVTHNIELKLDNLHLTNSSSLAQTSFSLKNDSYYVDHEADLDVIDEIELYLTIPANQSSKLKLGFHASAKPKTDLLETTKIADFNLLPGATAAEKTQVRVFNQQSLRNLLLGDDFIFYVQGEADHVDVTLSNVTLLVKAKFID